MKEKHKEVIDIYLETKSIRKTAKITGYSKTGVSYVLELHKIKSFPRNRKGKENSIRKSMELLGPNHPRNLVRNKTWMTELYIKQKLSITQIAKSLGVAATTVITGLSQCKIPLRTKSEALKGKPKLNIRGANSVHWRGGLSGWRKLARCRLNQVFVRPIMERDNFQCTWCHSKQKIVVHHHRRRFMEIVNKVRLIVDENNILDFIDAIVKEHSLDDGITLCKICHDKFHKENGK